ncbi:hypothetical protein VD17_17080 [Pseudomonas fluorescens]|uniref:HTH tetR-type domain-containing protein n=1 Tax=Pseudomonas fluorescens TaxID=294 RepID=A0A0F4V745_PSEFL|nr:hypothetical protein VD17_17080 [Pseudomonas fluorescens]
MHAPDARKTPSRRPQAERSAQTQAKLIAAAIFCLHRLGYSATTVIKVAQEAQVSRGAMTHQFPTKVDLMLAVVQHVFEDEVEQYKRLLSTAGTSREILFSFPHIMWEVLRRPDSMAVTEILMASRSDPALAEGLKPTQRAIERAAGEGVKMILQDAGFDLRPDGAAIQRLFVAAMRGLAIDSLFAGSSKEIHASVDALVMILHLLYPTPADLKGPEG